MTNASPTSIRLIVNDQLREFPLATSTQTLMRVLQQQGLTGTKEGCGDGDCGACTIALHCPNHDGGDQLMAVNSCLIPAASLAGATMTTVEGLAPADANIDQLHPVQRQMVECSGSQCGYCTPGFIMSLYTGYEHNDLSDHTVEGNLCRCTGYTSIRRAIDALAQDQRPRCIKPAAAIPASPRSLDNWHFPTTVPEALALKRQYPTATWVAGATDLGLEFSHGRGQFDTLIALQNVTAMHRLERVADGLWLGANVTIERLKSELTDLPVLTHMLHWFAAKQVRNRATLGGNIGTASPIGDVLPVLLALDAQIELAGELGLRLVPAADYFLGYRKTAKLPNELITRVYVPRAGQAHRLSRSYKVGKRGSDDISIVAASFVVDLDADQCISHARLAYGGVAAIPIRARATEQALIGLTLVEARAKLPQLPLSTEFQPLSDFRGSASYRAQLIVNLLAKFLDQSIATSHAQSAVSA